MATHRAWPQIVARGMGRMNNGMRRAGGLLGLVVGAVLAITGQSLAAEPTAESLRFFETSVRPLLVANCQKCHGAEKQWGGLRLDSAEGLNKGADSGPVVVAGSLDESRLIRAVRRLDPDLKMPPDDPLTEEQIKVLERWVEMGAPFAATQPTAARTRDPHHWSFQPLAHPEPPPVQESGWLQSPIDAFILARLEAAGLSHAPRADPRTLIRRLTFDLTGLPPTESEIAEFLADESPSAYARLVDRLLDSPAYGERWGRHWLDVARYADSNGLDENVAHGNAWRYRDYVVTAFNQDKPLDRFIVEQLAGDLLPAENPTQLHEHLIATGFLSIGAKVLAEVDQAKMQMDIVDEQIDTFGRAFLGLTLGCARCHDHKFDPIDTADYYGLAGIFKSTRTMDTYTKVARWHENLLPSEEASALQAAYDAQLAARRETLAKFVEQADQQAKAQLPADAQPPESLENLYPEETKAELKKLREELAAFEKAVPNLPSAMGVAEDQIADVAIHVRGNPLKLGDVVARHMPPVIHGPAQPEFSATQSGRLQLAQWLVDPQHPLTSRVLVNRVWRWHFGHGLVRTTDNFGLVGEPPSHPELLDWLAGRLIAEGWSLKTLHRLLLNSSTYQQSSLPQAEATGIDPENRLLSHVNVARLEAESVRDALLAVSAKLDQQLGGSLLAVENRGYLFDHTSKDLTEYTSLRRSLYLPVIRNNIYDLFQLFDYPDAAVSSGDRATTTIATQALLMMNSDLVLQSASDLAARLLCNPGDDEQRMTRLYVIAYGREPTPEERAANHAFLANVDQSLLPTQPDANLRTTEAWTVLCHVTLCANEFLYVK